ETSFNTFGQVLHYIYTVTNKGTSTLSAPFDLTDDLADVECEFPESLLPDEQFSCSGTYTVAWEDLDNGSITNQASATAKDADGDTVRSNTAEVTIYASQEPLIGIAKRTDRVAKVSAGTYDVTFEILVKNYGNVTLADVLAADDLTDTFPLPTTFSIQSINSDDLVVNPAFDGKTDIQLLDLENSLAPEEEKTLTLVVRVVPASGGPFNNSATAGATHPVVGLVSDISQSGDDPDPDEDKDPTNNNEPTPVDFGPELFDPPMGVKRFNVQNRPVIEWTMVWINDTNIANVYGYVQDPIPANTTFYNNGIDSGYPVPDGAPRGSISEGVSCTHSAISTTTLCYYEGPTLDHPLGQIIWEGTVGPDFGVSDPNRAANAVNISFNVLLDSGGVTRIRNIATINSDRNGDGDADDAGESVTATASQIWDVTPLPATGFAPGVVTKLPEQPEALAYKQTDDLFIEIPTIGVRLPIVGVSQSTGGWDLTWLGDQAGWLEGTAFPSWAGNSAITAHVLDSNGQPGPFADLHNLKWGDEVVIEAWGQRYVYEIREIDEWVSPEKTDFLTHEDFPWLTLITCKNYNPQTGSYDWRVLVRAVQVRVE
ncbi:MAG: sortase, partial [Chloroflexi bacterium]|nr:sortase [Chloroflexota bacterium]